MRAGVAALLVSAGLLAGTAARAADAPPATPEVWLGRMAQAVQDKTYTGTFVYLHDGSVDSMQLFHAVTDDGERERLVALNGAPREVLRLGDVVKCIYPDQKTVVVDKGRRTVPFPTAMPTESGKLSGQYEFERIGDGRVAGREAIVIAVKPRDKLRYGYRFWLDQKSALPLKSELLDESNQAVEQVIFTELELPDQIPADKLEPSTHGDERSWTLHQAPGVERDTPADLGWHVDELPAGFTSTYESALDSKDPRAQHLMFSDGLASVSVFIEPRAKGQSGLEGASQMGAVSAFGRVYHGYQITVVGEVPPRTVKMIADSLRRPDLTDSRP